MSQTSPDTLADNPWPHRLAIVLACATFPVIWVGGLVTTHEAGMAVPDWPSTYGRNLFLYPWQTWIAGPWDLFVEHGHRLLAATAGLLTIALVVVICLTEKRTWVKYFAAAALLAIIGQGVLGGMRVLLDERLLAKIHACTGPAFFALTAALACVTSRWWKTAPQLNDDHAGRWQRASLTVAFLAYLQIVLGAQLRHVSVNATPRFFQVAVVFHILVGLMLAMLVWKNAWSAWREAKGQAISPEREATRRLLNRPLQIVASLLLIQVSLGAGTWITNFGWPHWFQDFAWIASHVVVASGGWQSIVTTLHVAIGSLIFATSVVWALRNWRLRNVPSVGAMHWQGETQTWGRFAL